MIVATTSRVRINICKGKDTYPALVIGDVDLQVLGQYLAIQYSHWPN